MRVFLVFLTGCAWRVHLESTPVPARVVLPSGAQVATPAEVTLRYWPFGHQRMTVAASGYRTIETDLRRDEIRAFRYPGTSVRGARRFGDRGSRGEVRFLLVPEHGPAGTWSPDDLPE